ncbi:hypothetical protein Tco_0816165 [Tanacetum coccineum]
MSIQYMEDLKQQYLYKMKSLINEFTIKDYRYEKIDIKINELKENFNGMSIEINKKKKLQQLEQVANLSTHPSRFFNSFCYDDDDDDEEYTISITPVLPTEKPDNSLIRGISDSMCDVPFCDNSTPLEALKDHSEILLDSNNDYSLSDDDSLYSEDIDYVDTSPPDSELVSLEEKLLNINLLIAKIEALKDNPTPSSDFVTKSPSTSPNTFLEETNISYNSLPESKTFCFNLEEKSSGNHTSYTNLSLPDYEAFFCDSKPDSGDFTMDVVEDIFDNPTRELRVHVPNVLPTHPTLHLDSDFTLSSDSLGSDLVLSFPSGTRNKIFDPRIFIEV